MTSTLRDLHDLLKDFDEHPVWPSTDQLMREIEEGVDQQHGGPLSIPTLTEVRPMTMDEVRAVIRQRTIDQETAPAPEAAAPKVPVKLVPVARKTNVRRRRR